MKKSRFEELVENVKEAVAIHKGEKYPEREYVYDELDVKAIRQQFNFSQAKFALMLGISKRTLENWEQGSRYPTGPARRLLEIAARFPDIVYRAIFDRDIALRINPDKTMTQIVTRPTDIYFRTPEIRGKSNAPSLTGQIWQTSQSTPAMIVKSITVTESDAYMQV
jgi:putative transcriptional regulator